MKLLLLVRYGEYTNGHINAAGRQNMLKVTNLMKPLVAKHTFKIVSADIVRARESAEHIAGHFQRPVAAIYPELTASEEDGVAPDVPRAAQILLAEIADVDVLIAVLSREYIEALPGFLLGIEHSTKLDRGQAMAIDLGNKTATILNPNREVGSV